VGHLWCLSLREHDVPPVVPPERRWGVAGLSAVAAALWAYYGATAPALTSIAHLAAVVMGWLVASSRRCARRCGYGGELSDADARGAAAPLQN
jgi:hypothetical protein